MYICSNFRPSRSIAAGGGGIAASAPALAAAEPGAGSTSLQQAPITGGDLVRDQLMGIPRGKP